MKGESDENETVIPAVRGDIHSDATHPPRRLSEGTARLRYLPAELRLRSHTSLHIDSGGGSSAVARKRGHPSSHLRTTPCAAAGRRFHGVGVELNARPRMVRVVASVQTVPGGTASVGGVGRSETTGCMGCWRTATAGDARAETRRRPLSHGLSRGGARALLPSTAAETSGPSTCGCRGAQHQVGEASRPQARLSPEGAPLRAQRP